MEALYAYALLLCQGYDVWDLYSAELDRLYLDDPENEIYFTLELTNDNDIEHTVMYIISNIRQQDFHIDYFGQIFMKSLSEIYQKSDLPDFAKHMYALWNHLPYFIREQEPFFTLCYADDCLSYGDEAECRRLYEKAMHFYDCMKQKGKL